MRPWNDRLRPGQVRLRLAGPNLPGPPGRNAQRRSERLC